MTTTLPPELTVKVIPLATVIGPVTCAFVVAVIVISSSKVCALVLNNPPLKKLPLNSSAGVTFPPARSRKFTNMFAVPVEGAAEKVKVEPSGTVYAELS